RHRHDPRGRVALRLLAASRPVGADHAVKVLARTLARESPIGAPISNHRFLDHLETRGHTVHRCWSLPDDLADFDVLVMGGTTVEGFAIKAARNDVNVVAVVHSDLRPQLADLV